MGRETTISVTMAARLVKQWHHESIGCTTGCTPRDVRMTTSTPGRVDDAGLPFELCDERRQCSAVRGGDNHAKLSRSGVPHSLCYPQKWFFGTILRG